MQHKINNNNDDDDNVTLNTFLDNVCGFYKFSEHFDVYFLF